MTHLRFALAQIDTCVGDLDGNADKIMHYAHLAAHEGAHVVIFPEMTLTGYPIEDLALRRTFRKAAWDKANWLATELEADGLGDLYVAVGTVGTDHASDKPRNRMVVLHDGMVWAGYDKHFLPNYGVFDEFRIFAAGDRTVVLDIDGVRRFTVDFNAMTWSWERVTTPNCMPDTEVAAYPTKAYVTRDGGTKTWMTVGLHWAGDATIGRYKLGSGLVSGHQTGGYGNEAPYASRNPAYDTEENGGSIVEAKDGSGRPLAETYGRLYSSYESLTGSANGALNACEGGSSVLINCPFGEPGTTLIDAVGDRYVLESIMPADLAVYAATAAGDAQAEAEHPNLKMQIQGICPYGWHIANMQDWKDLVWAAHAQGAADYPVDAATATYRAFGGGTLTNFAALLFTSDWNIYNPDCPAEKISTAAADFGFNMFSQGWRLYKTGYDYGPGDNDPRMYSFIPLIGDYSATKKAGWRIWNQSREANMRTNGGFDFGNGCGGAVRCVKNYKK